MKIEGDKGGGVINPMLSTPTKDSCPRFRSLPKATRLGIATTIMGKLNMKTFGVVLVLGLAATCLGCSKDPASTSVANGAEVEYEGKPLSYWLAQVNDKRRSRSCRPGVGIHWSGSEGRCAHAHRIA